jgi:hypothetical protein
MYQTTLKTSRLGQTGLEITRVGFGAWALGGGNWEHGWGPQDDDESIAAIHNGRLVAVADCHELTRRGGRRLDTTQPGGGRRDRRVRRPDQVDPILAAANLKLIDKDLAEIEGDAR